MAEELKANQRKEWAKLMYLKENIDRKSTRLNSSHANESRMPSSA